MIPDDKGLDSLELEDGPMSSWYEYAAVLVGFAALVFFGVLIGLAIS